MNKWTRKQTALDWAQTVHISVTRWGQTKCHSTLTFSPLWAMVMSYLRTKGQRSVRSKDGEYKRADRQTEAVALLDLLMRSVANTAAKWWIGVAANFNKNWPDGDCQSKIWHSVSYFAKCWQIFIISFCSIFVLKFFLSHRLATHWMCSYAS